MSYGTRRQKPPSSAILAIHLSNYRRKTACIALVSARVLFSSFEKYIDIDQHYNHRCSLIYLRCRRMAAETPICSLEKRTTNRERPSRTARAWDVGTRLTQVRVNFYKQSGQHDAFVFTTKNNTRMSSSASSITVTKAYQQRSQPPPRLQVRATTIKLLSICQEPGPTHSFSKVRDPTQSVFANM